MNGPGKRAKLAYTDRKLHAGGLTTSIGNTRVNFEREELWALYESFRSQAEQVTTDLQLYKTSQADLAMKNEVDQRVLQAVRLAIGSMYSQIRVDKRRVESRNELLEMCDYRREQEPLDGKLLKKLKAVVAENNRVSSALIVQESRLANLVSLSYSDEASTLLESLDSAIARPDTVDQETEPTKEVQQTEAMLGQLETEFSAFCDRTAPIVAENERVINFIDAQ